MSHYIFSPEWFYGIDSLFESFSFIVTAIIAFYAYKLYKFSEKRSYLYFSYAFMLFSLGFLLKVLTNVIIYYRVLDEYSLGSMTIIQTTFSSITLIHVFGFILFRFMMLVGLLGIYLVLYKKTSRRDITLFVYLMLVAAVLSHYKFIVFHLTAIFLLTYIVMFYYNNFMKKKGASNLLILSSFVFMLVSQLFFLFTWIEDDFYVTGGIIQLAGFLLLLAAYLKVLRK